MFTFKFLHVDNTSVGFLLNKTVYDKTFIGNFEGLSGIAGRKGIFSSGFFPLGACGDLVCTSRVWLNRKQVMIQFCR